MEEGLEVRESASDSGETTIDGVARQVFGKPRRRDGWLVGLQRLKERRGPEVAGLLLSLPGGAGALSLVQVLLAMDRTRRVVGDRVQIAGLAVEVSQQASASQRAEGLCVPPRSSRFRRASSRAVALSSPSSGSKALSGMPALRTARSNTPTSESPGLIRWSRNVSGLSAVWLSSHRATRQRSTASGFLSTP